MNVEFSFKIKTKSYESSITNTNNEMLLMSRKQNYNKNEKKIEAYGEFWMIAFADLQPGQLSIRNGNDYLPITGPCGVLIGNYSIAEFQFNKSEIFWYSVSSFKRELPLEFNKKIILFEWDKKIPENLDNIFDSIKKTKNKTEIKMQKNSSAVAERTKKIIDESYSDILLINNLAKNLKYSRSVMTREFVKTYGLTPIEYRQKVRIYKAIRVLSSGASVTTALVESGFSSATQFFYQFKKHIGTQPFNYKYFK
ncbi:MAG: AraC family transcriptional regulator [Bdellovibrionaceae bacterium]|nr:AraC family transcriptional regulator [Pseudobdellovibrionaceae bacterium]NUM60355.1 helix-turn-helix transcriptional regulator [Pseudobdellovibrionaceae bacterium]